MNRLGPSRPTGVAARLRLACRRPGYPLPARVSRWPRSRAGRGAAYAGLLRGTTGGGSSRSRMMWVRSISMASLSQFRDSSINVCLSSGVLAEWASSAQRNAFLRHSRGSPTEPNRCPVKSKLLRQQNPAYALLGSWVGPWARSNFLAKLSHACAVSVSVVFSSLSVTTSANLAHRSALARYSLGSLDMALSLHNCSRGIYAGSIISSWSAR